MLLWRGWLLELESIWGNATVFLILTVAWICAIGSAVMFTRPAQYHRILFDMLVVFDLILVARLVAMAIATA